MIVLAAVAALRAILGPWPAAIVLAPMGTVGVVTTWATIERQWFPPAPLSPARRPEIVARPIDVTSREVQHR
jgi:hypothetical protein